MPLLDNPAAVADFLRARGVVGPDDAVRVVPLGGGVSNLVYAAHTAAGGYVVKQSLDRLRVAEEWLAPRQRTVTEAAAMRLAGALTPNAVPHLVDCDESRFALVMTLAPDGWVDWKQPLLTGDADPAVAGSLGATLAIWHSSTVEGEGLPESFADPAAFVALRVDPYHRAVARRRPELAGALDAVVDRMLATRQCLVHGDFSPKNVLVGPGGAWVTDFEVAHLGDPTFDTAFMITHLVLKSVHRPAAADRYRACATAFLDTYERAVASALRPPAGHLAGQVGGLLAARADGKSPAEYLDDAGRALVRDVAAGVLREPPENLAGLWQRLPAAHR